MMITHKVGDELLQVEVETREEQGRTVILCPPGVADGAFDLRNRGMLVEAEITCWPRRVTEYGVLMTGGSAPRRMDITAQEIWLMATLFTKEDEFQQYMTLYRKASEEVRSNIRVIRFAEHPRQVHPGVMRKSAAYQLASAVLGGEHKGNQ